jgi:GT2 family glycosyltransferase
VKRSLRGESDSLVAVVILTWNGRQDTLDCLKSLDKSDWPAMRVVVVDNASTDGTTAAIRDRFPHVKVLRSDVNLGFAGGNNLGIRHAVDELSPDYVLLLNNDTCVARDAVRRLVMEAEAHPDIGAMSPLIYYMEPPDRVWYAGATFDPRKGRSGRMTGYRGRTPSFKAGTVEVDRAVGAAMLVPCDVIERIGVLDEKLFYLYEDVDWSLRIRKGGLRVVLVPEAVVWHRVAASQKGSEHTPTTGYYGVRNHLEICARHAPLRGVRSRLRELTAVAVHLAEARHATRKRAWIKAVWDGWRDFSRGQLGKRV